MSRKLQALHAGLTQKGCTKRYNKVVERLGRLKERYKRVAEQYELRVERAQAARGVPAELAWGAARRSINSPAGRRWRWRRAGSATTSMRERTVRARTYVLNTSHTDRGLRRVARTHWQPTEIEATFRSLKSEIGLRLIWHAKQNRIRAHLFVSVLAYHGVHVLRHRLGAQGMHDSWETIRRKLASWMRLTTTLVTAGGERIECCRACRPDQAAAGLALAAGVQRQLYRVRTRMPID